MGVVRQPVSIDELASAPTLTFPGVLGGRNPLNRAKEKMDTPLVPHGVVHAA